MMAGLAAVGTLVDGTGVFVVLCCLCCPSFPTCGLAATTMMLNILLRANRCG